MEHQFKFSLTICPDITLAEDILISAQKSPSGDFNVPPVDFGG
jgi:hypothetical protein